MNWKGLAVLAVFASLLGGVIAAISLSGPPDEVEEIAPPPVAVSKPVEEAPRFDPTRFKPSYANQSQRSIFEVPVISAASAGDQVDDGESVIGLVIGQEARAYPLNRMAEPSHQLLNDQLGGEEVLISWDATCRVARAHDRKTFPQVLTFHVPGLLWGENMVMADNETKSLWSQILGEAKDGDYKGKKLRDIPVTVVEWKEWKAKYPQTTVASFPRLTASNMHRKLYGPGEGHQLVLAIADDKNARAWPFEFIRHRSPVNDEFAGTPLLAIVDDETATATLHDRRLDGQILEFRRDGNKLVDVQTQSEWDSTTGRATFGPLAGKTLTKLPAMVIRKQSWDEFHPTSTYWGPVLMRAKTL